MHDPVHPEFTSALILKLSSVSRVWMVTGRSICLFPVVWIILGFRSWFKYIFCSSLFIVARSCIRPAQISSFWDSCAHIQRSLINVNGFLVFSCFMKCSSEHCQTWLSLSLMFVSINVLLNILLHDCTTNESLTNEVGHVIFIGLPENPIFS